MATLTKKVTDVTTLGNYTLYGSSTAPINRELLIEPPVSQATITFTQSSPNNGYNNNNIVLTMTGPNTDQQIQLRVFAVGRESTLPAEPTNTTIISVPIESGTSTFAIQQAIFNALSASTALTVTTTTAGPATVFLPECGGVWTFSFDQNLVGTNTATCSIVSGGLFTTTGTDTQTGVRIKFNAAGANNINSRLTFSEDEFWFAELPDVNVLSLFGSLTGGTAGGWFQTFNPNNFFACSGTDNTTPTPAQMVTNLITAWNANTFQDGTTQTNTQLWEVVAVSGDTASFDFYYRDGTTNFTANPTIDLINALDISVASTQPTRSVPEIVTDPHKTNSESQVRWFDSTAANADLARVAPNYVSLGENSTWLMDNFSLNFDAGFRFATSLADNSSQTFEQVNITKTGDGQGNDSSGLTSSSMFLTSTDLTLNWSNCTLNFYQVVGGSPTNVTTSILRGNTNNIILNWNEVFIRYSGNTGCSLDLSFDKVNSSIVNSGLVADGLGTNFRTLIGTFDKIRLVEPFKFIGQSSDLTFFFNSVIADQTESYTNSDFFAKPSLTGPNISSTTIVRPFQNRDSFFKFLDFTVGDNVYINDSSYTNISYTSSRLQRGSTDYGVTFNPEYLDQAAADVTSVRDEFRYGTSTDSDELRVKEMFETGPIGGSAATIGQFNLTANIAVGTTFTIPRPNGLDSIILEAATTPVSTGNTIQFAIGADAVATTLSIENAFKAANYFDLWLVRGFNSPSQVNFAVGNNIGGTTSAGVSCSDSVNVTVSQLEAGSGGSGTFTHPFKDAISYIDSTDGLLNVNTSTDNKYSANTSTSVGVGNNNGLFLTYTKSNYLNNTGSPSSAQRNIEQYKDNYTVYTKKAGYRPQIVDYKFSDGPQAFSKILITDINWENVTKATADAYTRADMTTTNQIYRWIENQTNEREVTGQGDLTSVYDRFIKTSEPVDSGALIDFEALNIELSASASVPTYASGTTTLTVPVQSTLNTGGTTLGFKTSGTINLTTTINFNDIILETSTLNANASSIENGVVRATTTNSSGNVTGTRFQVPPGATSYTVNHTGGTPTIGFHNAIMESGGTLNTTDTTLFGLTANTTTINYQGTTQDFSIDNTANLTNCTVTFDDITQSITFNVDTDLSQTDLSSTSTSTVRLVLGANGVLPRSTTGNFFVQRTLDLGLAVGESVQYIIQVSASPNTIIANTTFSPTIAGQTIGFGSTTPVDVWASRTDSEGYKYKPILVLSNSQGEITRSFGLESDLNSVIQSSSTEGAALRTKLDAYVSATTLTIDTGDGTMMDFILPTSFNTPAEEPVNETYWNSNGGRGSGQYIWKKFEQDSKYGLVTLANKASLSESSPQLIVISSLDRLSVLTKSLQLHSVAAATAIAFFPGQFIIDTALGNFSIVGSTNGLVVTYQSPTLVVPGRLELEVFGEIVTDNVDGVLDARRVTRPNMNNLGILAPIDDSNPT